MELDILVITSEPLLPLTTVEGTIVGGFTIKEQKTPAEHKLLAVATLDPSVSKIGELDEVDKHCALRSRRSSRPTSSSKISASSSRAAEIEPRRCSGRQTR
ncbi:MAG TPA: inorganic diphosphatase [Kofleriaceae bacterium]|jgi:hypothetical protein|nr:inorganic diphosphatase [Kofleriaceae bacterium]